MQALLPHWHVPTVCAFCFASTLILLNWSCLTRTWHCSGHTSLFQRTRHSQRDVLAPWRGDDLNADRQWRKRYLCCNNGKADERNGLRVNADIGPQRKL